MRSLEFSDFITPYIYYGHSSRDTRYKLTDFYSLFYLRFIDRKGITNPRFWQDNQLSPSLNAWRGFSFEEVCFVHQDKIKEALGIASVHTEISPWRSRPEAAEQTQIDMLIDRADRIVNVCEMKFTTSDFVIDRKYDAELRRKLDIFTTETRCRKPLHPTLVTTYGLTQNEYSGRMQRVVTMDDLF